MNTGVSRSKIFGVGEYPSGTFRFKKIDGSFWNGETFRFADYIGFKLSNLTSNKYHLKVYFADYYGKYNSSSPAYDGMVSFKQNTTLEFDI